MLRLHLYSGTARATSSGPQGVKWTKLGSLHISNPFDDHKDDSHNLSVLSEQFPGMITLIYSLSPFDTYSSSQS